MIRWSFRWGFPDIWRSLPRNAGWCMRWQAIWCVTLWKDSSIDCWIVWEPIDILYILPLLSVFISFHDVEQVVRTILSGRFIIAQSVDCLLGSLQYFDAHGSTGLYTVISQYSMYQCRFLQMCEVGKRHAAELKHQSCYRLCATQVAGLGDFVEQPVQFVDGQCLFCRTSTPVNTSRNSRGMKRAVPASTPRL